MQAAQMQTPPMQVPQMQGYANQGYQSQNAYSCQTNQNYQSAMNYGMELLNATEGNAEPKEALWSIYKGGNSEF